MVRKESMPSAALKAPDSLELESLLVFEVL
jgi:hypothetical protein